MIDALNEKVVSILNSSPRGPAGPPTRATKVKASDFGDKTVKHILDFEVMIANYFTDQARDYISLLESPFTRHHKIGDKLDTLPKQSVDKDELLARDGAGVNIILGQKMNALAWMLRSKEFIADEHVSQMLSAYRNSEVPVPGTENTSDYPDQITKS